MSVTTLADVPDLVARHVAQHIANTATKLNLPSPVDYLQDVISEITVQTQITGPALLRLLLIDVDWRIQRSGLCDVDSDGLLQQVDVNYPEGTDVWWRLAMVEGGNDLTAANLTLTFQHRIVPYLNEDFGHLTVAPGTTTRAQFIKQLADRIPGSLDSKILGPGGGDSQKVLFVCPELSALQPLASATGGSTVTVSTSAKSAHKKARTNKSKGVGAGANLTVGGNAVDAAQTAIINTALTEAASLNAGSTATVAMIYAAMGETGIVNTSAGGSTIGVWQQSGSHLDVAADARCFLQGGQGIRAGGAIGAVRNFPSAGPVSIANFVEINAAYLRAAGPSQTGNPNSADSYGGHLGGTASALAEAKAIVAAGGGASTGTLGSASNTVTATTSDVSQLTRGTSSSPDEDSWTCMQRLASEVNWRLFTDPHPAPDTWGNYLYYMTGPDLDAQKPAFYMDLDDSGTVWSAVTDEGGRRITVGGDGVVSSLTYTFDNTAFLFQSTKKRKGKVQRKTRIQTPQTPSQCKFNMIVDYPMQWNAGQVIVFQHAGPLNGRWIIEDVTHNSLNDSFAQFTLGPPTAPNPEPVVTSTTTIAGAPAGKAGVASGKSGNYGSPFTKKYRATVVNTDMGVDFGTQQGISPGDSILAIGDCYLRNIIPGWYNGQPGMFFELTDKSAGFWGWYVAEQINMKASSGTKLIKGGTIVATFASSGTGIEIGWAASATQTASQANGTSAARHAGSGTPEGNNFRAFLQRVGAIS